MRNILPYLPLVLIGVLISSCNRDGCIDPTALNFDPNVENDDGSCVYLAENLNFSFNSRMGAQDLAFDTGVQSASGRMVRFTRAQMYLSGFTFNGPSGSYEVEDPYMVLRAGTEDYNLGYLPVGSYTGFSFNGGVDSASNHVDPATWPSSHALSADGPDHMHWSLDTGYVFFVLEGMVDTTAGMNGAVDAPFLFHVGMDANLVSMAFVTEVVSIAEGVTVEMEIDWLRLLDGTDMVGDQDSRITHTFDNEALSYIFVANVDDAFNLHP